MTYFFLAFRLKLESIPGLYIESTRRKNIFVRLQESTDNFLCIKNSFPVCSIHIQCAFLNLRLKSEMPGIYSYAEPLHEWIGMKTWYFFENEWRRMNTDREMSEWIFFLFTNSLHLSFYSKIWEDHIEKSNTWCFILWLFTWMKKN